jgi:hypothetical protein
VLCIVGLCATLAALGVQWPEMMMVQTSVIFVHVCTESFSGCAGKGANRARASAHAMIWMYQISPDVNMAV